MFKMATPKKEDEIYISDSSGSDFDDDEDPDKIEVPGGGKDLATVAVFGSKNKKSQKLQDELKEQQPKSTSAAPSSSSSSGVIKTNQISTTNNGSKKLPINISEITTTTTTSGAAGNRLPISLSNKMISTKSSPISISTVSSTKQLPIHNYFKPTTATSRVSTPSALSSASQLTMTPIIGNLSSGGSATIIKNANFKNPVIPVTNAAAATNQQINNNNNNNIINNMNSMPTSNIIKQQQQQQLMQLQQQHGMTTKGNMMGYDIKPNLSSMSNPMGIPSSSYGMGAASAMMGMGMGMGLGVGGQMSGYYPNNINNNNQNMAALLAQMEMASMGFMPGGGMNGMSGMAGMGGMSGMGGMGGMGGAANGAVMQNLHSFMVQNLQKLIAANPNYLTAGIPNDLLSKVWMEPMQAMQAQYNDQAIQDDEEGEDEEMGVAETYADYWPAKLKLGKKHPDPVVETASLSSVEPADVTYKLSIPLETINAGLLSALQLESITYASQAHEQLLPDGSRAGFLIGDGAGVGKGRTIAGIIHENYLKGRKKSLWISVSNDLRYDAERDLRDIGAHRIDVHQLNKLKYAKISSAINNNLKKGVIFSTYSALIGESNNSAGKYKTRLKQLLQWCGDDFDGCVIFDECHKAKNLCPVGSSKPTKTGLTVLELQNKLPKARVVYASATGASEPRNMAYMVRLGMWGQGTPFTVFNDFISAVEKRGVGAMEIVAMDMKLRGMYIARQLSFHGVSFKIEEVPLSDDFRSVYDESVRLWVEAMQKFTEAAELIDAESRMKKTMWGQFWSAHQRFFKYLCIAAKVNHAVMVAREAIKCGKCVVIGLQSTGEARTLEQLEREDGELSDFVSTAKGVIQSLVEKHFPAPDRNRIHRLLGIEPPKKQDILSMILDNGNKQQTTNDDKKKVNKNNNGKIGKLTMATTTTATPIDLPAKRKSARQALQRPKRRRYSSEVSDFDDDEDDDADDVNSVAIVNSDISEYKGSDSESNESFHMSANESDESSDFNPFRIDSDSDDDPWVAGRKQKKKTKKKIKKKKVSSSSTKIASTSSTAAAANTAAAGTTTTTSTTTTTTKKKPTSTQDKIQEYLTKKHSDAKSELLLATNGGNNGITGGGNYSSISAATSTSNTSSILGGPPPKDAIERACAMKEELLKKIDKLGDKLPPNTLDQLIDELGGPNNVAEMTGRKGRIIQTYNGSIQYESRSETDVPLETLNLTEKQRFMNGEKDVAIISEAASSGISLQSDRRVRNQRRRVHITLELPWSADRAVQQFGRTHRSNQVNAPEYIFLISDLAGERRFASTVAKRLESLGALTHGDRRATETRDLSQFNIDNKYGRSALEAVMKTIMGYEQPIVPPPQDYTGDFFKDIAGALVGVGIIVNSEAMPGILSLDKDYNNISKFLNRILGMPVELQNRLFKYFTDTLTAIIIQAKKLGRFDLGILDLGAGGENVRRIKLIRFIRKHATGIAPAELHTVQVERGLNWEDALDKWADLAGEKEGFYLSHTSRNNKQTVMLAIAIDSSNSNSSNSNSSGAGGSNSSNTSSDKKKLDGKLSKKDALYQIYRPNTGLQIRRETLSEIEKKYKKITSSDGEKHWTAQYKASVNTCSHAYWRGNCRTVSMGNDCEIGLRRRTYTILSGSVLAIWSRVEQLVSNASHHHHHSSSSSSNNNKMQVIRLKTIEGHKIVGTLIPKSCVDLLVADLRYDAEKVEEQIIP